MGLHWSLRHFGLEAGVAFFETRELQLCELLKVESIVTQNVNTKHEQIACAYLAFVCVFASLLVLADTVCLQDLVVLARAPCARMPCTSLCLRVCFVCTWSTYSIAVSSPTP